MGDVGEEERKEEKENSMSLADPAWELLDPTPDVQSLFIQFDQSFFNSVIVGNATVRWSKRMYSAAGTCGYNRNGIDIALSEPLLKFRTRKDLVETLLHEMIHAFLFITLDNKRHGHGRIFRREMNRINQETGLNITVRHHFHNEHYYHKYKQKRSKE